MVDDAELCVGSSLNAMWCRGECGGAGFDSYGGWRWWWIRGRGGCAGLINSFHVCSRVFKLQVCMYSHGLMFCHPSEKMMYCDDNFGIDET